MSGGFSLGCRVLDGAGGVASSALGSIGSSINRTARGINGLIDSSANRVGASSGSIASGSAGSITSRSGSIASGGSSVTGSIASGSSCVLSFLRASRQTENESGRQAEQSSFTHVLSPLLNIRFDHPHSTESTR